MTTGFFEWAESVWAAADLRREMLGSKHGDELGDWLADIQQYGAAWWGDVREREAIWAEDHPAFDLLGQPPRWDYSTKEPPGHVVVAFRNGNSTATPASEMPAQYLPHLHHWIV